MGLSYVTDLIGRIVLFVPKVMVAVLMLAFGAYFARFIGTAVTTYGKNVGVGDAEALGRFACYAIMIFVILIALDQLGLGDIIRQTFLIILAAVALRLALAFGLGGRKRAAELLERWTRPRRTRTLARTPERARASVAAGRSSARMPDSRRVAANAGRGAGRRVRGARRSRCSSATFRRRASSPRRPGRALAGARLSAVFGRDAAVCAIGMALSGDPMLEREAATGPRHAGGAPGRQRPDSEVRRRRTRRGRFLVSRLHRRDAVVADRPRLRSIAAVRHRGLRRRFARRSRRSDPLAAVPGTPAVLPAAAERGERLGRHHAALRVRPLHQRALAPREAPLPAAAARPKRAPASISSSTRSRRDWPSTGGRACSCTT